MKLEYYVIGSISRLSSQNRQIIFIAFLNLKNGWLTCKRGGEPCQDHHNPRQLHPQPAPLFPHRAKPRAAAAWKRIRISERAPKVFFSHSNSSHSFATPQLPLWPIHNPTHKTLRTGSWTRYDKRRNALPSPKLAAAPNAVDLASNVPRLHDSNIDYGFRRRGRR